MAERREIILDNSNLIAAAQVLSWIALPHRPQAGVDLLCNWFWARRRHRGEPVPELPVSLKKGGRIGPQLEAFRQRVLTGFRAGQWFEMKALSGPSRPSILANFNVSTRSLGDRRATIRGTSQGNEIRDVWSRRKPVAHLAAGAGTAIAAVHRDRGVSGFDLEMTLFDPVWVNDALDQAESRARGAGLTGAADIERLYQFTRDSF